MLSKHIQQVMLQEKRKKVREVGKLKDPEQIRDQIQKLEKMSLLVDSLERTEASACTFLCLIVECIHSFLSRELDRIKYNARDFVLHFVILNLSSQSHPFMPHWNNWICRKLIVC